MRITYLINSLKNPGGMERVLINKANYLSKVFGYNITIITTDQDKSKIFFKLEKGVNLIDLDINYFESHSKSFLSRIIPFLKCQRLHKKRLKEELLKNKSDFTVSLGCEDFRFLHRINDGSKKIREMHFGKDYRKVFVRSFKKSFLFKLKAEIDTYIEEINTKKYYKLVILTYEDEKKWMKNKNIQVIYNSIPKLLKKKSNLHEKCVISVGRLDGQKGFDLLIKAWEKVNKKLPEWKLNIFGDGIDKKNLDSLILDLNLNNSVMLKGISEKINNEYFKSSLYVMSSRYEGFGLVLVEAMNCGLPVISFACPSGPSDIIKDGANGYLVENGNIDKLAETIIKALNNKEKLLQMGKSAKMSCERFSEERIMKEWRLLFEKGIKKQKI